LERIVLTSSSLLARSPSRSSDHTARTCVPILPDLCRPSYLGNSNTSRRHVVVCTRAVNKRERGANHKMNVVVVGIVVVGVVVVVRLLIPCFALDGMGEGRRTRVGRTDGRYVRICTHTQVPGTVGLVPGTVYTVIVKIGDLGNYCYEVHYTGFLHVLG
jgi:hypothetical protein